MSERSENSLFFLPDFVTSCCCTNRSLILPSDNDINDDSVNNDNDDYNDDNVYNDIEDYNDVINDKRCQLNRHFNDDQSPKKQDRFKTEKNFQTI